MFQWEVKIAGEAVQKSVSVTGGVTHVYEKTSSQASA